MKICFYPADITIAPATDADGGRIIDLFNHYVEHSFAAFPESPLPHAAVAHTAETTCFVSPEQTGRGIGGRLLIHLEEEGREKGIKIMLASISSLIAGSMAFHRRQAAFRSKGGNGDSAQAVDRKKGAYHSSSVLLITMAKSFLSTGLVI
jgi:L-amino acid N-acyltransferase YncA